MNFKKLFANLALVAAIIMAVRAGTLWQELGGATPAFAEAKKQEEQKPGPAAKPAEQPAKEAAAPLPTENANTISALVSQETSDKKFKDITEFSASEISLLQSLRERREELAKREQVLDEKEKVLVGIEKRIQIKIEEMNGIKGNIEKLRGEIVTLSKNFRENEDKRIGSLRMVYEKMKPKDAARIFDNLELTILLEVVQSMQGNKLSAIMANMDPQKATLVTTKLAQRATLPQIKNVPDDFKAPPINTPASTPAVPAANTKTPTNL